MRCFEILVLESHIRESGGRFVSDGRLTYGIPEEAQALVGPILKPYEQDPMWYFDMLNQGRGPAPWALACLDRAYAIAGHIAESRTPEAGISFTGYTPNPIPPPADFIPKVGTLVFYRKDGLESVAGKSPVFSASWEALRDCSTSKRWLAILDPLPQDWLELVLPGDSQRWQLKRGR